jgi:hypothetical protein
MMGEHARQIAFLHLRDSVFSTRQTDEFLPGSNVKKKKGKVVAVLNEATRHECIWRNGGITPPCLTEVSVKLLASAAIPLGKEPLVLIG